MTIIDWVLTIIAVIVLAVALNAPRKSWGSLRKWATIAGMAGIFCTLKPSRRTWICTTDWPQKKSLLTPCQMY